MNFFSHRSDSKNHERKWDYNFQVHVVKRAYGEYPVRVFTSLGETQTSIAVTDPLQISGLRSKLTVESTERVEKLLGTLLFQTLLKEEALTLFYQTFDRSLRENISLRIQLLIEPNELSVLPWELMFEPKSEKFLALGKWTTIERLVAQPLSPSTLQIVNPTMKILALVSSPANMPALDVHHSFHMMQQALTPLVNSGHVTLSYLIHPTLNAVQTVLQNTKVDLLYLQGHMSYEVDDDRQTGRSYFLMEDSSEEAVKISSEQLGLLLHDAAIKLVLINSYEMNAGLLAYELVQHGAPVAVANQEPLNENETIAFLSSLTKALSKGLPVSEAVRQGRRELYVTGITGCWASPVLFTRTPDTLLFVLER